MRLYQKNAVVNNRIKMQIILMCFGAHTTSISPSVTHMGIFRNFNTCLHPEQSYKNISLILHGFGAYVEKQIFKKEFLVFQPLANMLNILKRRIDESEFVTDGQEDVKVKLQEHFDSRGIKYLNDNIPNGIQDANITNSSVKDNLSAFIVQQCVRFAKLGQKN